MFQKIHVPPPPVNRRPAWLGWGTVKELLELLRRIIELLLLVRKLVPA